MVVDRWPRILVLVVGLLSVETSRARAGYQIIDLGRLAGGPSSVANGLNNRGQVVGHGATNLGFHEAFVDRGSAGMLTLGPLPGGRNSEALGINDQGLVVGRTEVSADGRLTSHAFVATPRGPDGYLIQDLKTLKGGTWSEATAINASGLVVGAADVGGRARAFAWKDGVMTNLGTLPGGAESWAHAVNDRGDVTGWASTASGQAHAFRMPAFGGQEMVDLGTLPGAGFSVGRAINDLGEVAGYSGGNGQETRAFLAGTDGLLRDLGVLKGAKASYAFGLNDDGLVVGSSVLKDGRSRAFVWDRAEGMTDLNSLILPGSGWELSSALAINDRGQIVGYGLVDVWTPFGMRRQTHAFLLDPIPPVPVTAPSPASAVLMALGCAGLFARSRLRRGGTAARRGGGPAGASPGC